VSSRIVGLVVKIVERCNLNCSYCYMYNHLDQSYRDRPTCMSEEIFASVVSRLEQYREKHPDVRRVQITFHGGEPMLMKPEVFRRFAEMSVVRLGQAVSLAMQTNATLVTDEWIGVLKEYSVRVGVSLDGPAHIHDSMRVYHSGRGSYNDTVTGLRKFQQANIYPGVLCVVNPTFSGEEIYQHFRSLGIRRINFLMPDACHDTKALYYGKFGQTPIADYLIPAFNAWLREDNPLVTIRLFEECIRSVLGGRAYTDAIGNMPENYLVIETDGSIHANDALKVCDEGVSETGLNVRSHSFDDLDQGAPLLYKLINEGLPLCDICQACPEGSVCGGGSVPHRYSRMNGFDNPSIWCADLLRLFSYVRAFVASAN
jgi:uncharacterized protein